MTMKIGFIGAGAISEVHYQALQQIEAAEVIGFYEPNGQLAAKRAQEWGAVSYSTLAELLEQKEIELIYVLSPVELHVEHATSALEAGKHVLVEKPVAMNVAEIEKLERAAKKADKVCFPAHNYVYHPEIIRFRRHIEEGVFGQICSVWMTFNLFHSEELASHYPGVNRQIMTHHLYTTLYLLGLPKTIACHTTKLHYDELDQEDQSIIILGMENGAQVVLFSSFACDDKTTNPWTYMVKILGSNGGAVHNWQDVVYERSLGTLNKAYPRYEDLFYFEAKYVIEECIAGGKPPLSTLTDAKTVQELVELAERHQGTSFVSYPANQKERDGSR